MKKKILSIASAIFIMTAFLLVTSSAVFADETELEDDEGGGGGGGSEHPVNGNCYAPDGTWIKTKTDCFPVGEGCKAYRC